MSIHKKLSIGFPLYILLFELALRMLSKVDISAFLGPTLAASGLGLMIEILKPQAVTVTDSSSELVEKLRESSKRPIIIKYESDENLISTTYGFILLCVLLWFCSCQLSILSQEANTIITKNNNGTLFIVIGFIFGCINYAIGIYFSTLKENMP